MPDIDNSNTQATSPLPDSLSQPGASASGPMSAPNLPAPDVTPQGANAPDVPNRVLNTTPVAAPNPNEINPAGSPVAPPKPPPKHEMLLRMVTSLADGLSATGKSFATGGKEGGAEEVQQLEAQRQQMKQSAVASQQAQTDAELQNKLTTGKINSMNVQAHILGQTWQDEVDQSHFKTQEAQQNLAITGADFMKANWGMTPEQASGKAPLTPQNISTSQSMLTRTIGDDKIGAVAILGKDNPAVIEAQRVTKLPAPTAQEIAAAGQGLIVAQQQSAATTAAKEAQGKAAEVAPLGAKADSINAMTEKRFQVLNAGKPLPDAFKVGPNSTPADAKRIAESLQQTEAAQGTAATRELTNQIHQQTLDLLKGPQGIDPTATGPAYLDAVTKIDPAQANMIKGYGQGRIPFSAARALTAQGQGTLKQILRAYPNYVVAKAEGYQKQYNEFTSGKVGTSINSYKTSLDHLNDAFDNVERASTADLNNPTSTIHRQLDVDKEFLSTELAKAVSNGNMTEGEKAGMLKAIDGKTLGVATKGTYQDKLRETVRLLGGKLDAFQSQWKSTAVEGVEPPSNLTDAAAATQKLAGGTASNTHIFNATTWGAQNPGKDVNAAIAQAKAAGYQVKQ
jgi:hypothetical protein